MRKGPFAHICEGKNNKIGRKWHYWNKKKRPEPLSFYSSFFSGMVKLNTEPSPSTESTYASPPFLRAKS